MLLAQATAKGDKHSARRMLLESLSQLHPRRKPTTDEYGFLARLYGDCGEFEKASVWFDEAIASASRTGKVGYVLVFFVCVPAESNANEPIDGQGTSCVVGRSSPFWDRLKDVHVVILYNMTRPIPARWLARPHAEADEGARERTLS